VNWRNPDQELPAEGQLVFVMLDPHKWRGSMLDSAASIMIVGGWYRHGRVENNDEIGEGSQCYLLNPKDESSYYSRAIAWIPVEEMAFPKFKESK
jgi:hypothetical protein